METSNSRFPEIREQAVLKKISKEIGGPLLDQTKMLSKRTEST